MLAFMEKYIVEDYIFEKLKKDPIQDLLTMETIVTSQNEGLKKER